MYIETKSPFIFGKIRGNRYDNDKLYKEDWDGEPNFFNLRIAKIIRDGGIGNKWVHNSILRESGLK